MKCAVFAILGTLTGLAAVLNAVRFNQIPSNAGIGLEMKVIAAVVVGGASVAGGRGDVPGTVLGVVLLAAIGPALTFLGISAYWERAIQGAIILVAIAADGLRFRSAAPPSAATPPAREYAVAGRRLWSNGEWPLLAVLAAEIVLFAAVAPSFFTLGNFFEMTRFSVELGLLAVALTPVIVAGGIDLSVGSMMGLAAVVLRRRLPTWQLPLPLAARVRSLVGCAGGALNALLIARLELPALIVTLGTFSLFRGIAEGITAGRGQLHRVPAEVPVSRPGIPRRRDPDAAAGVRAIVAAYVVLLHRSVIGPGAVRDRLHGAGRALRRDSGRTAHRSRLRAVGAGGERRGDHLRRASRAGAVGCGHRLRARRDHRGRARRHVGVRRTRHAAAVRCSGCSRWRCCRHGLHLAAWPSELTGILTGVLLLATIAADRHIRGSRAAARPHRRGARGEEQSGRRPVRGDSRRDRSSSPARTSGCCEACATARPPVGRRRRLRCRRIAP